jgi:hypothetical protein
MDHLGTLAHAQSQLSTQWFIQCKSACDCFGRTCCAPEPQVKCMTMLKPKESSKQHVEHVKADRRSASFTPGVFLPRIFTAVPASKPRRSDPKPAAKLDRANLSTTEANPFSSPCCERTMDLRQAPTILPMPLLRMCPLIPRRFALTTLGTMNRPQWGFLRPNPNAHPFRVLMGHNVRKVRPLHFLPIAIRDSSYRCC